MIGRVVSGAVATLLGETEGIPGGLAEVRALTGCLEEGPLLELEVLWGGSVGESTRFVIGRD